MEKIAAVCYNVFRQTGGKRLCIHHFPKYLRIISRPACQKGRNYVCS